MQLQMLNLIIPFIATVILGIIIVPKLRKYKVGQIVRDDGPKEHLKKSGTPTMGGVIILITLAMFLGICSINNPVLLLALVPVLGFGIIGFIDDYKKLILKNTDGLSPKLKMIGLFLVSAVFVLLYINVFKLSTTIIIPYFNMPFDLSLGVFVAFVIFVLLGASNSVNLTDGLDGLATGVVAIIMTFFTIMAFKTNDTDMIIFGLSTIGACLGFLIFNVNPAKVFMGDTGSLALGGAIAAIAIILKMPLYLAIVAIIPILEAISVMLQVVFFKLTKGKRLFKMAPLHHHFELCGLNERVVTVVFWIITILACGVAYII